MAGVTKADIPNESVMMGMLWNMIKEFYIPENSNEYWEQVAHRADEIDAACHSRLGQKLILAYMDYLEEKQKEGDIHGAQCIERKRRADKEVV